MAMKNPTYLIIEKLTQEELFQISQDLTNNAIDHHDASKNEHIWALGSDTQEESIMHEANAGMRRNLAKWYISLKEEVMKHV